MDRKHFGNLKRVMQKRILTMHGFRKGKQALYYRALAHGTVGIDLQTSEFRNGFFVNVAWTFAGLPGFLAGEQLAPESMNLLDFAFHARLERVARQPSLPACWLFMNGESEIESTLQRALALSVAAGESIADHFSDTQRLLDAFTPNLVLKDYRDRLAAGTRENPPEMERIRSALHGYYPEEFELAYSLFHLSRAQNQSKLADEYLDVAKTAAWHDQEKALVHRAAAAKS